MNVRYYFITDQIKRTCEGSILHMQEMIADFFMKPLQGALFILMQERILNLPASKIAIVHRSVLKERTVEEKKNPKIDFRIEDLASAGKNKNDGRVSKVNKTGKDVIKERNENENMTSCRHSLATSS